MTQTLPRLSMARPLPDQPVLKVSALVGSPLAGKRGDVIAEEVGDPDVVLLVNGECERRQDLARISKGIGIAGLAKDFAFGWIALGEMNQVGTQRVGGPDIPTGRNDDALHFVERAAEGIALGWREWLTVLVEQGKVIVARETRHPCIVIGVDGQPETGAEKATTGEAGDWGRERCAIGRELRDSALPEVILRLGADLHIVVNMSLPPA